RHIAALGCATQVFRRFLHSGILARDDEKEMARSGANRRFLQFIVDYVRYQTDPDIERTKIRSLRSWLLITRIATGLRGSTFLNFRRARNRMSFCVYLTLSAAN